MDAAASYFVDSFAWSVVWLFVGYLAGLVHANLRDLWKRDR